MRGQILTFLRPVDKQPDWTRDELAELYRIEHALVQARFNVTVDRGATDEGDPWFVFCRPDGEVLVTISRIDGEYILSSPGLRQPLRGASFNALSKSFVDQIPLYVPLDRGRQGARLYVHPAAMLSVVIGTIFIAWEDARLISSEADEHSRGEGDVVDRASFKAAFQAIFQSSVDAVLAGARDFSHMSHTTFLTLISTIAAFAIGAAVSKELGVLEHSDTHDLADDQSSVASLSQAPSSDPNILEDLRPGYAASSHARLAMHSSNPGEGQTSSSDVAANVPKSASAESENSQQSKSSDGASLQDISGWSVLGNHSQQVSEHQFELPSSIPIENVNLTETARSAGSPVAQHEVESQQQDVTQYLNALKIELPINFSPATEQNGFIYLSSAHSVGQPEGGPTILQTASHTEVPFNPANLPLFDANLPLFDDAAAAIINQFLRAHEDDVELIMGHHNIIFYDPGEDAGQAGPLTVQAWETKDGVTIAIVGHADDGGAGLTI